MLDKVGFSTGGFEMARQKSLATMSVDALISLRDEIARTLSAKAQQLQKELARLGGGGQRKRGRPPGTGKLKGRKVAPKYRSPNGETWSGRGLAPKWMAAEIKAGKKKEDFLIGTASPGRKKAAWKK